MLPGPFNGRNVMKKYQPLLLQKLDIHVPGIQIRRLALHRHLPETTDIRPHAHKYAQCLLYLSGQGQQRMRDAVFATQAGTAVFAPPGVEHAFHRVGNRRPICLIIDFDWRGAPRRPARVGVLPFSMLGEIRRQVAGISHMQRQSNPGPPLLMSSLILKLLNSILGGMALTAQQPGTALSPVVRKVESLLEAPDSANLPLSRLAQRAGYQHDYLNRLLKSQAGLTLGQFRARKLVERAQQLLRQKGSVAAVASAVGFSEPNYFARWFRQATGLAPSRWRQQDAQAAPRHW